MRLRLIGLLSILCLCFSSFAFAQVPDPAVAAAAPQPGSGHHYIGNGVESVSPADGMLTFDLPIQTPPGRQLSFPFGIRYSSSEHFFLANPYGGAALSWWPQPATPYEVDGWSYKLPVLTALNNVAVHWTTPSNPVPIDHQCDNSMNYVFRGLDGTQYTLSSLGTQWVDSMYSNGTTCTGFTSQGDSGTNLGGLTTTVSPNPIGPNGPGGGTITIADPSGTIYSFVDLSQSSVAQGLAAGQPWGALASTITDRNGNRLILGHAAKSVTDTMGRTVVSWTGIGTNGDQITVSGLPSNITLHWTSVPISFPETGHDATGTVRGGYQHLLCGIGTIATTSINVVNEIDLPNGKKYTLSYDATYGKVSRITFPGGGYVRYVWGLNRSSASGYFTAVNPGNPGQILYCDEIYDTPAVTDRYVSYDGTTEVLHQNFAYYTVWDGTNPYIWDGKTTTVTSTDLLTGQATTTTYNYAPIPAPQGGPMTIPLPISPEPLRLNLPSFTP